MLTPDFAFCHELTLERWTGREISRETYSPPEILRGRVNFAKKRTLVQSGGAAQEVVANGTIFLPAGTRIQPEDKLTFEGTRYTAISCQPGYWFDGRETHVEVMIQ